MQEQLENGPWEILLQLNPRQAPICVRTSHIQIGTQSYRLAQLPCFILSLYSFFKVHTLVEL